MTQTSPVSPLQQPIQAYLNGLNRLSAGERAALKHSACQRYKEVSGSAMAAFYKALPRGIPEVQEGRWFAIAGWRCLWHNEKLLTGRPFEMALRMTQNSDSFDTRVRVLLDCSWDDLDGILALKLYGMVRQLRQKRLVPDFSSLLYDLIYWNHPDRFIQKKWAHAYFGGKKYPNEEEV